MSQSIDSQYWVLVGTAQASTDVWGIRRISFPCGYSMPAAAYAKLESPLQRPSDGEVWAIGGIALEIGTGGRDISIDKAASHVAGYRPWISLFYPNLLDELQKIQHTITVWDQGVSMFYGLWRDACQTLGPKVSADIMKERLGDPVQLSVGTETIRGEAPKAYEHDAATIIHFMSQFMTLSAGDIYVIGPLVAQRIPLKVNRLTLSSLGSSYSVEVE